MLSLSHAQQFWKTKSAGKEQQNVEISLWLQVAFNGKKGPQSVLVWA